MANVTQAETAGYSSDMDAATHEGTYVRFTHFTAVAAVFVLCIVVSLAIGAGRHAWTTTIVGVVLAHLATAAGLSSRSISWRPGAVLLVLLLLCLGLY